MGKFNDNEWDTRSVNGEEVGTDLEKRRSPFSYHSAKKKKIKRTVTPQEPWIEQKKKTKKKTTYT